MAQAFIELRRFEEAIVVGKEALHQNSTYPATHRCLASAFTHLGRDVEAREAAARVLELEPDFTISTWIARGGQSNSKLFAEVFAKRDCPSKPRLPILDVFAAPLLGQVETSTPRA